MSVGPESGDSFLVCDHVLTRDVADSAAVLDVLAGYEPGDATWAPPPPRPFAASASLSDGGPGRLRIGLAMDPPLDGSPIDPVCAAAARDAATLLSRSATRCRRSPCPGQGRTCWPTSPARSGPQVSMVTLIGGQLAGREPQESDVEPLTWSMWEHARELNVLDAFSALMRLQGVARAVVASMTPYDAVLTPALGMRPVPIGEIHGRGPDPWGNYQRSAGFTPYTAMLNVTGQPAVSVPLYPARTGCRPPCS